MTNAWQNCCYFPVLRLWQTSPSEPGILPWWARRWDALRKIFITLQQPRPTNRVWHVRKDHFHSWSKSTTLCLHKKNKTSTSKTSFPLKSQSPLSYFSRLVYSPSLFVNLICVSMLTQLTLLLEAISNVSKKNNSVKQWKKITIFLKSHN